MQSQYRVRSLSPEVELMDVFLRIRVNHNADGRHRVDSRNESTLMESEKRLAPLYPSRVSILVFYLSHGPKFKKIHFIRNTYIIVH
jgi:hypothetical protein